MLQKSREIEAGDGRSPGEREAYQVQKQGQLRAREGDDDLGIGSMEGRIQFTGEDQEARGRHWLGMADCAVVDMIQGQAGTCGESFQEQFLGKMGLRPKDLPILARCPGSASLISQLVDVPKSLQFG